jgi:cysteine-rich repeat protein
MRARRFGTGFRIVLALSGLVAGAGEAVANCNVIPGATEIFRGALGSTDRPFAIPGDIVALSLEPGICDGETTAFIEQPGGSTRADDYRVTLVFTPQQGAKSAVVLATDCAQLGAGSPAINACSAQLGGGTATCIQANTTQNPNALSVADALHLSFRFPDTDALVGTASDDRTLAGPVKIAVTPSSAALPCQLATQRCADGLTGLAACIDEVYAHDGTCRTGTAQRDTTFSGFTALPPPNDIDRLVNAPGITEARFTVDAAGNVLLPMDYQSILVRVGGRPFPRLTRGGSSIDAWTAIVGSAPIAIPSRSFLSSWSPEGIRLPPVFEPLADPGASSEATLFGTVDAPLGVIRIAKRNPVLSKCVGGSNPGTPCDSPSVCLGGGACTPVITPEFRACSAGTHGPCASDADCAAGTCGATVCYAGPAATATACTTDAQCASGQLCGPSLFDFADRSGPGPVIVAPGAYSADVEQPVTLEGTQESESLLSFVVPEPIDGLSRNGDTDATDPVVVLRDRSTGLEQDIGPVNAGQPSEGRAVSTAFEAPFQFSDVAVEDDLVAFSEPEVLQGNCTTPINCDQNADKDVFDHMLRVYRLGQSSPVYMTPQIPVDVAPVIDGKSLAISDGLVFFRTREADVATNTTGLPSGAVVSGSLGLANVVAVSEIGGQIAFASEATNLVAGDTNASRDVFVRSANGVVRVSVSTSGTQAASVSDNPAISDSGRFVAFISSASNLVAGDTNALADVFVRDRDLNGNGVFDEAGGTTSTTRIDLSTSGVQATGGHAIRSLGISGNGRHVVFESQATNLVSGDTNSRSDIFLRDRDTDADGIFDEVGAVSTTRISVATDGTEANSESILPRISDDGREVCFISAATNLVAPDANADSYDVYVRDRDTDRDGILDESGAVATIRVSVATDGTQPSVGDAFSCDLSDDGRIVVFDSSESTLVGGDTNSAADIFVHDRDADGNGVFDEPGGTTTRRISVASDGTQANGSSYVPRVSSDGRYVAFTSSATNLVPADTNGLDDVFEYDRLSGTMERESIDNDGSQGGGFSGGVSGGEVDIAGDARTVAFKTWSGLGGGDPTFPNIATRLRTTGLCAQDVTGDCDFADTVARVLDARAGSPTAVSLGEATQMAVARGNAMILRPNGSVARYLDRSTTSNVLSGSGVAVAASAKFGAALHREDPNLHGDVNGDGDLADTVPTVIGLAPATSQTTDVPYAAATLAIADTVDTGTSPAYDAYDAAIALLVPESQQGNADQTGDGDHSDRIVQLAGVQVGGTAPVVTPIPVHDTNGRSQPADEVVLGAEIAAFRTTESAFCNNASGPSTGPACASTCSAPAPQARCGGATTYACDLNCDGDCCDDVLQAYDLVSGPTGSPAALVSSGRTVVPCTLEACDPREPYKVIGSTVRFLEDEHQQNEDLNHDGDADDLVVEVFNARDGVAQVVSAVQPAPPDAPSSGPNPLDPGNAGGTGSGSGTGGGFVGVNVGRCLETTTTVCTTVADCATGQLCGAGGFCQRDHGTCRTVADCPAGVVTVCDTSSPYTEASSDRDGDTLPDADDDCPDVANPDQADADGDGTGDACDLETCGNSIVELTEECDDGNVQSGDGCSAACRIENGPCDDGIDNDGDGLVDFGEDPGCQTASSPKENPKCDDGIDNDGDGKIDWDGGGLGLPDPQCVNNPWRDKEAAGCGLGAELALLLAALRARRSRIGSARR